MTERKHSESAVARKKVLRYAADRLCLWCLCRHQGCRRAKACRGDAGACAGRMRDWLLALEVTARAAPSFAALERTIETPEALRLYRAWREAHDRALESPPETPAALAAMRDEVRRRILALAQTAGDPEGPVPAVDDEVLCAAPQK